MNQACLILSHSITPRLQYIIDFLSQYYGLTFRLTSDEDKYRTSSETCRINYGYQRLVPDEIFIHAHVLLTESSIRQVRTECSDKNGYRIFFKTEGDTGFDIFAASFYLLTRYEEYLPHNKDIYGRYAHENSLAFRENFLNLPLVNIWLEDFRKLLAEKNKAFSSVKSSFVFLPTYDIDMAWSMRNKGIKRNAGAVVKDFLRFRFRKVFHRIRIVRRKMEDPYDAYEWMDEQHSSYSLKPFYFFLVAGEKGKHDKNISPDNIEFIHLIRSIAERYQVGLHPSWISVDVPHLLKKEKHTLEQITGSPVHASRQHFIRFQLPLTYQRLSTAGISHDYSMGYGTINGFRASIATPYFWYDLKNEQQTNLMVHPFCFMDANSFYEQGHTTEAAYQELIHYYGQIKKVNGTMITIWHNSFLGTDELFTGWRDVYQKFLSAVTA